MAEKNGTMNEVLGLALGRKGFKVFLTDKTEVIFSSQTITFSRGRFYGLSLEGKPIDVGLNEVVKTVPLS